MLRGLIGKKLVQTQAFTEGGKRIPVTRLTIGPCRVTQLKTEEKDGYWAVQLGFESRSIKRTPKPLVGHLQKTGQGTDLPRFLREIRLDADTFKDAALKVGDVITADQVFHVGDVVDVTGISKAKGFAGVVKRHGFAGGPRTHGQSDRERAPGSIGQTTTPGRVYKGKRMAGRMGGKTRTIQGLTVVNIDPETNTLEIKGLIPGSRGIPVLVQK